MQTIGERLEEARKKKGLSLREAAEAIKIRGEYLQQLESNKFDLGLSELYVRGFLRAYARHLDLPADKILSDFTALSRGDPLAPRSIPRPMAACLPAPSSGKVADEPRAETPVAAKPATSVTKAAGAAKTAGSRPATAAAALDRFPAAADLRPGQLTPTRR